MRQRTWQRLGCRLQLPVGSCSMCGLGEVVRRRTWQRLGCEAGCKENIFPRGAIKTILGFRGSMVNAAAARLSGLAHRSRHGPFLARAFIAGALRRCVSKLVANLSLLSCDVCEQESHRDCHGCLSMRWLPPPRVLVRSRWSTPTSGCRLCMAQAVPIKFQSPFPSPGLGPVWASLPLPWSGLP